MKTSPNQVDEQHLLSVKNNVKKKIQTAKSEYYHKAFKNCDKKPLKMWNLINSLCSNKPKLSSAPSKLETHLGPITELTDICDHFNTFFSQIGSTLASKIPHKYHDNFTYTNLYNKQIDIKTKELTHYTPTTTDEVNKIIDNLNSNTSTGLDGLTCKALKSIKPLILEKLTCCINNCLERGYFPDSLKLAKVSAIFKPVLLIHHWFGKYLCPGKKQQETKRDFLFSQIQIVYNRVATFF
ncbi:unnamed protein product [Parnassius mnemosyne]|uniref:Reverse transcriptase n=1 Tax=Parnassius mnemosyne TaxID=213953 RepID=A0AAV1K914_9NEOP